MILGQIFAMGKPDFIKKRFSAGFHLMICPKYEGEDSLAHFMELKQFFIRVLFSNIPGVKKIDRPKDYFLRFVMPFDEREHFVNLFEILEKYPSINVGYSFFLFINSFAQITLEMLTLEDAIINLANEEEKRELSNKNNDIISMENLKIPRSYSMSNIIIKL